MISRACGAVARWVDRHWLEVFGLSAVALLLLIVLWPLIIYNVPAGHVGVMWYRFFGGTVTDPDEVLGEGLHIIFPWDKIYIYDARLQRADESVTGLSVDGLNISVNLAARFVIEKPYAGYLHQALGPQYVETLIRPQLRTMVLTYISEQNAADLHSTRRSRIQSVIETQFQSALAGISTNVPFEESYVKLEDVLIEEIRLPEFVQRAIEEKEKVRHMSEAYEFRIQLEEKERQRKRIEAEGIRSFQEIVAPGITDSYLRWRGIEATLQLAQSKNAKVVIIGNGADGLPIILNTDSFQGVSPDAGADAGAAANRPDEGTPAIGSATAGQGDADAADGTAPPSGGTSPSDNDDGAPSPSTGGSQPPAQTQGFAAPPPFAPRSNAGRAPPPNPDANVIVNGRDAGGDGNWFRQSGTSFMNMVTGGTPLDANDRRPSANR